MIKKIIASTVMMVLISTSGTLVYANTEQSSQSNVQEVTVTESAFQVVSPERNVTTTNKNMILTFTAPEGTTVTVDVYHNNSSIAEEENFVQIGESIEMEVGSLQRRFIKVELRKGRNMIEFNAVQPNGTEHKVIRFVTLKDIEEVKQEVKDSINQTSPTQILQKIVNMGREQ